MAALLTSIVVFAALLLGAAGMFLQVLESEMEEDGQESLAPILSMKQNLDVVFERLDTETGGVPCGRGFVDGMRRIALMPDGLSEFLYMNGDEVRCSVSKGLLDEPIFLGPPALSTPTGMSNIDVWPERKLDQFGFPGVVASIARRGSFAVVFWEVPSQAPDVDWLSSEVLFLGSDGNWHRRGSSVPFPKSKLADEFDLTSGWPILRRVYCGAGGRICAVVEASLLVPLLAGWPYVVVAILLAMLAAMGVSSHVREALARWWSLESRFLRNLRPDTVQCLYQPIISVETGKVAACEVLARWRDVDGSTVFPDCFIPLVEKNGLTLEFTRMVVDRAWRELSNTVPGNTPLMVTFNVFPNDLLNPHLLDVFRPFIADKERFVVVAELVESEEIDVRTMQSQIDKLRSSGIRVVIDDFGTGYSNIKNLVDLSVDGVKIDRAFAMAQEGTMAARMLDLAVEMIHAAGRVIVVEGIESEEKLDYLRRKSPVVDYAQGFHISRPIDIEAFVRFVEQTGYADRRPRYSATRIRSVPKLVGRPALAGRV
ncbi:EAL domain-containing protein [Jiella mangrovi]|uniref:cyclic-guanylate-specific phosphodiesterase n=1 Tax=Jiella mangrovi TaxID=2821407 RepID=A0ABS4BBI1_9HYPH|nr:EAL domain-containing protein [Jiella mangrovi]MBP0614109.1 EAL domain-containing protein [Jiella mangrovi]